MIEKYFITRISHQLRITLPLIMLLSMNAYAEESWQMHNSSDGSTPTARHEATSVAIADKLYLMGGRGLRPVETLDTQLNTWKILVNSPEELHHFQPVVWGGKIYVLGAFTGDFPNEINVPNVKIFDPANNTWADGMDIPIARRRGSAGAVVYKNKIYLLGGNASGHNGGAVDWFDEYDPATGQWKILQDAPHARDHFSAAIIGDKLIAASGRRTQYPNFLENKEAAVDLYNFNTSNWENSMDDIPTPRAGAATVNFHRDVIVIGGEATAGNAESVVEALDIDTGKWRTLSPLITTRHGHGAAVINDYLYAVSGNKVTGGGQELDTVERLKLILSGNNMDTDGDGLTDSEETNNYMTDPQKADTDGDALNDGDEVNVHNTDPLNSDSDNDSLGDGSEVNFYSTDPLMADSDGDSLNDGDEINLYNTDPLKADTDEDTLPDDAEINTYGTDPLKADTDGDSLSDSDEINNHNTDPLKSDSDDDGLTDADEINQYLTDPLKFDTDDDGLSDGAEINDFSTDPISNDSDGDTLNDGAEINLYNSDPLKSDSDNDGLDDGKEVELGTDLLKTDTDGDGDNDGFEVENGTDPTDKSDHSGSNDTDSGGGGVLGFASLLLMLFYLLNIRTRLRYRQKV